MTKISKSADQLQKMTAAKRKEFFESMIGKEKYKRKNTVFNFGSNMLIGINLEYVKAEQGGLEKDTALDGNDTRHVVFIFKNADDSADKTEYKWTDSNILATGKRIDTGSLELHDLRSGITNKRAWVMVIGEQINTNLPSTLDAISEYFITNKVIKLTAKVPIYAIPFGTEDKETAKIEATRRDIYFM